MQIRSYMESNQGWNEIGVADSGLYVKIKGEEIYDSKEVKTKETSCPYYNVKLS